MVLGSTLKALELDQKEIDIIIISILKYQAININYFTNNMESAVWDSVDRLRELTYEFSQIEQWFKALENLESEYIHNGSRELYTNWLGGIMDSGGSSKVQEEIYTIL